MNKHSKATHFSRKGIPSVPKKSRLSQFMSKPVENREHAKKAAKMLSYDEQLRQMKKLQDQRARQFQRRLKREQKAVEYRKAEQTKIKESLKHHKGA